MAARPQVRAALDEQGDLRLFEEADILQRVLDGEAWLWMCGESAAVVDVIQYPRCRSIRYVVAGGKMADIHAMEPVALEWAKRTFGVVFAEYLGRKGWLRELGFKPWLMHGWKEI